MNWKNQTPTEIRKDPQANNNHRDCINTNHAEIIRSMKKITNILYMTIIKIFGYPCKLMDKNIKNKRKNKTNNNLISHLPIYSKYFIK